MKTKILLISALLAVFASVSFGEQISRVLSYNGPGNQLDRCNAVVHDKAGFVYATGVSWGGSSKEDFATIKFGENGDAQWIARYNGSGNNLDHASAITVDGAGNVYVTGWSRSSSDYGSEDYMTIKYNQYGVQQWAKRYDGAVGNDCYYYDYAKAIWVDDAGNVYVTGQSWGNDDLMDDYLTLKYNSAGTLLWAKRYNGPASQSDIVSSLYVDMSGNVYVTGGSEAGNKEMDVLTVKYNSSGSQQWAIRYNGPANKGDMGNDLKVDKLGYVYVTGGTWMSSGKFDYVTIKYNPAGQQQWLKTFNGTANDTDMSTSLDLDVFGHAYVTGYSKSTGAASHDFQTIKYSTYDGAIMWSKNFNGGGIDKAWDIKVVYKPCSENTDVPCWDIDVYLTGQSVGTGTSNDFMTIRYNDQGVQKWANRFNGPTNGSDIAYSISVTNNYPIIYVGGSFANDYGIIGITETTSNNEFERGTGLSKSYPNPFNPETNISFNIAKETNVKITVFDMLGKTVRVLSDSKYGEGAYSVNFNASELNSGVYFYRIETAYMSETKKLVLIK